eukprot:CAMPEP_0184678926 /NCGR_PEP_ID=MMETSP0312-20130426/1749_1 /TAXON_ID=31354 /ORGANISM="Compsopogon coeruleus, Strain SAG 36.94" /LENGTH=1373 /DNA_ID=CAMNT_0027128039 /DNA_START=437 /DNA_END=4558 /DNA_ORIENTATION=+
MELLYKAQVSKPFSGGGSLRPWQRFLDWCEGDDLIAAISGCGGTMVFHADAPGEVVTLTNASRAPARHVRWKPAGVNQNGQAQLPVLMVADASGHITLWVSQQRRVNVWRNAAHVRVHAAIMAVGWIRNGTAVAAVLSDGNLVVWGVYFLESSTTEKKLSMVACPTPAANRGFLGGPIKLASIAPGGVDLFSVAVLCTMSKYPDRVSVWHISVANISDPNLQRTYDLRDLGCAKLEEQDGNVAACLAAPRAGSLYIWGDKGYMGRWVFARNSDWTRVETIKHPAVDSPPGPHTGSKALRVSSVGVSSDGDVLAFGDGHRTLHVHLSKEREMPKLAEIRAGEHEDLIQGLCMSPSSFSIMILHGNGILAAYSIDNTKPNQDQRLIVDEYAQKLIQATSANGRRGGWDIRALLARKGRESSASVAKAIQMIGEESRERVTSEKIETLRLAILASPDEDTGTVAAARRLLEIAIDAIKSTAPQTVIENFVQDPVAAETVHGLCSTDHVLRRMQRASAGHRPSVFQVTATPMADWIILLGIVWLRRVAAAVARSPTAPNIGNVWREVVQRDGTDASSERVSIMRDPTLTKNLKYAAVAAASLLVADAATRAATETTEPRYIRLSKEDTADVVAAIWDTARAAEAGGTPGIAAALGRHLRAASAFLQNDKVCIQAAERALGLRGACRSAGYIVTSLRPGRGPSGSNGSENQWEDEWCPFDIITGRIISCWLPLRRCVSSGLLATEIANPPEGMPEGTNGIAPWAMRWANESPFGGLWTRVHSLDLDRYEPMHSADLPEEFKQTLNRMSTDLTRTVSTSVPAPSVRTSAPSPNAEQQSSLLSAMQAAPSAPQVSPTTKPIVPSTHVPPSNSYAQHSHDQVSVATNASNTNPRSKFPQAASRPTLTMSPPQQASSPILASSVQVASHNVTPNLLPRVAHVQNQPGQLPGPDQVGSPPNLTMGTVSSTSDQKGKQNKSRRNPPSKRTKVIQTNTPASVPMNSQGQSNSPGNVGIDFALPLTPNMAPANSEDVGGDPSYSTTMNPGGTMKEDNQSQISTDTGVSKPKPKRPRVPKRKQPAVNVSTVGQSSGTTLAPNISATTKEPAAPQPMPMNQTEFTPQAPTNMDHSAPPHHVTKLHQNVTIPPGKQAAPRHSTTQMPAHNPAPPPQVQPPQHSTIPSTAPPSTAIPTSQPTPGPSRTQQPIPNKMVPTRSAPQHTQANPPGRASRIWQGSIHLQGQNSDLRVPCVAITHSARERANLRSAVGWPSQLHCTRARLKSSVEVWPHLDDPSAQWYVRFCPVDANGNETSSPRLMELVKGMVERKLAFELDCDEDPMHPGKLYLWGFNVNGMGMSLLGVYRPVSEVATGDDAAQLLNDLLGGP